MAIGMFAATRRGSSAVVWVDAPPVAGAPIVPNHTLSQYRVVYRVDVASTVTTEELSVARPFDSVLVTRSGAPPGAGVLETRTSTVGKVRITSSTGPTTVIATPIDLAASDLRLDASAGQLIVAGLARWDERRRVLGSDCQVLTTTAPPQGQQLAPLAGNQSDVVKSCVDEDGLILEQVRVSNGRVLLRRRAVRVETNPSLDAAMFTVDEAPTIPTAQGGGSVVLVDPSTLPPGPSWFLDAPPAGFVFVGHFAVAEATLPDSNGLPSANRRAGFSDVWQRGPDTIVLDQGGTLYGSAAFGVTPGAHHVELGALGTGDGVPGPRFSEVRVQQPTGRYVRLAGTLPLDQLGALASTLRRADRAP